MRISHATPNGETAFEHDIPQFGLGVFLMSDDGECKSSVLNALNAGYTHIDTARAYNNEHEVGQAIRESGVDRNSVFITTKLRRGHATGYEETIEHCRKSLELLDMDYIDLYLVHA
ncbi:MAG TPA: aldo/keto reductase, partial [Candidatus Poseidoniaceae archaeon]